MKLEELRAWLDAQNDGLGTMRAYHARCTDAVAGAEREAAALQLLGLVTMRFIERYEGEPLYAPVAKTARERLLELTTQAARAASEGADAQVACLNALARADLG